jgi:hypothetical protein
LKKFQDNDRSIFSNELAFVGFKSAEQGLHEASGIEYSATPHNPISIITIYKQLVEGTS